MDRFRGKFWGLCLSGAVLFYVGCGSSDTPETAGAPSETKQETAGKDTPVDVVTTFLQSVKNGDEAKVESMLTPLAQKKTKEADLYVAPPGTPTAQFTVGEFEIEGNQAQVFSTWTDVDAAGESKTEKVVWVLRNEKGIGWRISGMVTAVIEGRRMLELNFEDPEDMMRKQQAIAQEMAEEFKKQALQEQAKQQGIKSAQQPPAGNQVAPK